MWPYNHCEWKIITYGVQKPLSYWRKYKGIILMSLIPSITLVTFLFLLLTR